MEVDGCGGGGKGDDCGVPVVAALTIAILGRPGVGKTSYVERFTQAWHLRASEYAAEDSAEDDDGDKEMEDMEDAPPAAAGGAGGGARRDGPVAPRDSTESWRMVRAALG